MELPEWYDEKKFNRARKFYDENSFTLTSSMLMGLVAVFAIPSILRVLVGTRRSNSVFTAYRRYLSTLLHTVTWFEHELKPGTTSWKSLYTVRSRHARATLASKAKGIGIVSQRDVALTQFGFVGFSMLRPDLFAVRQLEEGDWDAYNHFWRVIGHMIGLQDRYNICRSTIEETREVLELLLERVFTPCLENVPEYFEHMARVMLDGMWSVNPTVDIEANIYWCRYLARVPGYIYNERDRIELQTRLKKHLNGKPLTTGVDSSELLSKPALDGLPSTPPRLLYYNDYNTIETAPAYKRLSLKSRYKLVLFNLYLNLYSSYLGRLYFNWHFKFSIYLMRYFPYVAFFRFGVKASLVNIFAEDPADDTKPLVNAEYYKPQEPMPWYKEWLSIIW
ncbi:hypothetical protein O3G_MSEX012629 [Manduca sexta]|uniref:ER-bound oxygenase mpaB/mpaB'/Rubber oxygenase catalytic domain-containing protein n=2 Tax=Manduca sexta TaxID=7130 RepID=A0A922CXE7_MANSE|nr:hypothetical protein O3G_MSEX012629 [Manduca sexta]KAG6461451.1 hypothetical protein O3G_MSEX012629 [Manduca sexta]